MFEWMLLNESPTAVCGGEAEDGAASSDTGTIFYK